MSKASLIYLLLAGLSIQACAGAEQAQVPSTPRTVLVTRVQSPANPADTVIGQVRSSRMDVVSSEVGGRVVALLADVGDRVVPGQPLARLDASAMHLRLEVAIAERTRAVAAATERARNVERIRQLVADGTASPAELEAAVAEATAAQAVAKAAVAEVALANRDSRLAVLRAPSNGVIAARPAVLSAFLAPGAPAFEIEGSGERRIRAFVPAHAAARLTAGARIAFRYDDGVGEARLIGISNRDSGAGGREANFAVVSGAPLPGSTVEVMVPGHSPVANATVPQSAIIESRDGTRKVRVVDTQNRVRDVPVQLLGLAGANAQVDGRLSAGDLVVAAGGEFLQPGLQVRPHLATR